MICEYGCGKEAIHQFKNSKWCCSKNIFGCPEVKEKVKQTCLEKFGEDNPSKAKVIKEKKKQTSLENFGVDHPNKSFIVQNKRKQTCIENYGVDHPSKTVEFQKKIKQTNLEKYGVDHLSKTKKFQKKIKQTNLEKYGVDNPSKSIVIKEKKKQTCMENYGVEYPSQSEEIKEKSKQTCLENFGVGYPGSLRKDKTYEEIYGEKKGKKIRLSLKHSLIQIQEKYPTFYKVEKPIYNPDKPGEKEIQVHCKYEHCKNSKENGGWFTPTGTQLFERIRQLETDYGNDGSYLYCSQHCKDNCKLYNLRSDPNEISDYSREVQPDLRQIRLEIDNYQCQKCKRTISEVELHCHHLEGIRWEPLESADLDKVITYCKECHYNVHQIEGCRYVDLQCYNKE